MQAPAPQDLLIRYEAIAAALAASGEVWDYTTVIARLAEETGRDFLSLLDELEG